MSLNISFKSESLQKIYCVGLKAKVTTYIRTKYCKWQFCRESFKVPKASYC